MALTVLRTAVGSGGTKYQATIDTTGAASVMVGMPGTGVNTANITSSRGNVATYIGTITGTGGTYRAALYWCNSVTNPGAGDVWANPDGNVSGAEAHVVAFSDGAGATIVGSFQSGEDATFSGTTTAGGSGQTPLAAFTSTQANDSIIGTVLFGSAIPTGITASPAGTTIDTSPGASLFVGCTFHHNASTTGSVQPVVSWTGSTRWVAIAALVRPAAAVPATLTTPTQSATGKDAATVGATTDTPSGTLYALPRIGGSQASGPTIVSTGTPLSITSTGAKNIPLTGLTIGGNYVADLCHASAGGNSNVVTTAAFVPTALALTGSLSAQSGTAGASLTWTGATPASLVTGNGIGTRSWSISNAGGTGLTSINSTTGVVSGTLPAAGSYTVQLTVTDQSTAGSEVPQTEVISFGLTVSASGDTTAPTLSSPSATGGTLVCSGSVSTNEANGTLYTVFCASATAPTAVQVEAGQDASGAAALRAVSQVVTATGTQTIASGSITAGTRSGFSMHKDAAGNRSAVLALGSFSVTGPPIYGFDFNTITGAIFGNISGSLVGLAREVGASITVRVYNASTGALVATSSTLTTDSNGRLPRWTDAALANATTYDLVFKWADGSVCAARMTTS